MNSAMKNHANITLVPIIASCFLFSIYFFAPFLSQGQKSNEFQAFLHRFPPKSLPATIAYERDEFDYGYYSDENFNNENDTSGITIEINGQEYQNSVLLKDDSLIITYELMHQFLMADTESVTPGRPVNETPNDTRNPTYYISSKLNISKPFYCVVYERQLWIGSNSGAEKYLCTLNKKGKLLDKILVASANFSGTGIMGDSFRVPWFPDVRSEIMEDLTIHFKDANRGSAVFKINSKGKILKIETRN